MADAEVAVKLVVTEQQYELIERLVTEGSMGSTVEETVANVLAEFMKKESAPATWRSPVI